MAECFADPGLEVAPPAPGAEVLGLVGEGEQEVLGLFGWFGIRRRLGGGGWLVDPRVEARDDVAAVLAEVFFKNVTGERGR
ncbi:MAG: hypothetical protein IPK80_01020 [Nannocystis sp.]|nr:hypothetical protein [Nannocystis sp.]